MYFFVSILYFLFLLNRQWTPLSLIFPLLSPFLFFILNQRRRCDDVPLFIKTKVRRIYISTYIIYKQYAAFSFSFKAHVYLPLQCTKYYFKMYPIFQYENFITLIILLLSYYVRDIPTLNIIISLSTNDFQTSIPCISF